MNAPKLHTLTVTRLSRQGFPLDMLRYMKW